MGDQPTGGWALALWAAYGSRVIVWVAAMIALALSPPGQSIISSFDQHGLTQPFHSAVLNRLLAPAARYDSVWYLQIAHQGYYTDQAHAFFPVYPLAIKLVAYVVNQPLIVGMVISLVCFTVALYLLYRLALLEVSEPAARLTVWLMALFPLSLFYSAIYTESIFLMLSVGAIYMARTDRWAWAGVLAGLASATRSDGLVLIVVLMWLYWTQRRHLPLSERIGYNAAWLTLAPLGLAAYLVYCKASGSTLTAPFHAASYFWGRGFKGPFSEIWTAVGWAWDFIFRTGAHAHISYFDGDDPLNWTYDNLIDLLWLIPTVAALVASWRYLPRVYFVYAILIIVASASTPSPLEPMMSYARYVMVAFPLFMGPAVWLSTRPRWQVGVLGASGLLLGFFSALWGIWAWVA